MTPAATEGGPSSLVSAPSYAGPWSKLQPGLHPALQEHVTSVLGFAQMTPVQSSVIPLFLSHKDVIVEAVTGSGKTLAYALPVLQMMMRRDEVLKKSQIGALIICPTRELAIQVHGVLQGFLLKLHEMEAATAQVDDEGEQTKHTRVSSALLTVGGSTSSPADDYRRFKEQGCDIVIGTPGRIEELMKRPGIDAKELDVLVLDEADRLLDLGFHQQLSTILQLLPKQRRTGLFSATMTDAMGELVRMGLRNPVRVVVKVETKTNSIAAGGLNSSSSSDKRMPASLENTFALVDVQHKLAKTIRILRHEANRPEEEHRMRKAIVYFATCAQVDYFYKILSTLPQLQGLKLYSLYGKQTPARRRATFDAFVSATPLGGISHTEACSVLLCTDVAARGLDLPNVDLVVQFDAPTDPKVFSHRCGRTARAGRHGRAVILLTLGREEEYVEFLRVRKNPVRPYLGDSDSLDVLAEEARQLHDAMRVQIRSDRALYELSMQAFVSFVQCYRKHEVSFVFRERDLDLGGVAYSFALLRLPRMPEVDRWRKASGVDDNEGSDAKLLLQEERVDMKTFAFADAQREKQRLAVLKDKGDKEANGKPKRKLHKSAAQVEEEAWSHQKARKDRKQLRRDKKQRKRAFLSRQAAEGEDKDPLDQKDVEQANAQNGASASDGDDDGVDDWAQEERSAKRARRKQGSDMFGGLESNFDDL